MSTKTPMKYRIVGGKNPKTGEPIKRPVITERETYYIDKVVEYAIKNGYVRGQFHDMRGALNGFIEAIEQLGRDGKCVNLNNWLRVHAELTGTVDETMALTAANALRVNIAALQDLKTSVDNFAWTNVSDTGAMPRLRSVSSAGGKAGEIIKDEAFTVSGLNLSFRDEIGDKVELSYEGLGEPLALTPSATSETFMTFAWPAALDELPVDTEITITVTLHGTEGGSAKSAKIIAKIVG